MLLYQHFNSAQITMRQSVISSQFDSGFDPEFSLSIFAMHMDMHARFFQGEEEKPETAFPEYRRTHGLALHNAGSMRNIVCNVQLLHHKKYACRSGKSSYGA